MSSFNVGDYVFFIDNNQLCRGKILNYLPGFKMYNIKQNDFAATIVAIDSHKLMDGNLTVYASCDPPQVGDLVCRIKNNQLVYFIALECDFKNDGHEMCSCVSFRDSSAEHRLREGDWYKGGRVLAFYNNIIYIKKPLNSIIAVEYTGVEDEQEHDKEQESHETGFHINSLALEIVAFDNFDGKVNITLEEQTATFKFSSTVNVTMEDFNRIVKELKKFTQKNFPEIKYYCLKM